MLYKRTKEIVKKRRGKSTRGVLLLQDNAPAYTYQVAMAAATKCSFEVLPHPPYSPEFAPSDFCLFPNLKLTFVVVILEAREVVIDAVDEYLGDQEDGFYLGICKLEQRWRKCIEAKERLN